MGWVGLDNEIMSPLTRFNYFIVILQRRGHFNPTLIHIILCHSIPMYFFGVKTHKIHFRLQCIIIWFLCSIFIVHILCLWLPDKLKYSLQHCMLTPTKTNFLSKCRIKSSSELPTRLFSFRNKRLYHAS